MTDKTSRLRQQILDLTAEYFEAAFPATEFKPGQSTVPVSGKTIDADDLRSVMDSVLDAWFTSGRFAKEFERKLASLSGSAALRWSTPAPPPTCLQSARSLRRNSATAGSSRAMRSSPSRRDFRPLSIRSFRIDWCRCLWM